MLGWGRGGVRKQKGGGGAGKDLTEPHFKNKKKN